MLVQAFETQWEEIKGKLSQLASSKRATANISQISFDSVQGSVLLLSVPSKRVRSFLEDHFHEALTTLTREVMGETASVAISVDSTGAAADLPSNDGSVIPPTEPSLHEHSNPDATEGLKRTNRSHPQVTALSQAAGLNPRFTFEDFIIGNSNRFAHAAAMNLAEDPKTQYTPLFIYGAAGLGKTHLLHAIGNYVLRHDPNKTVIYVPAETFASELIDSIQRRTQTEFKARYRQTNVFLLDDIQFFEGKEGMQEEFFHTFNHLHGSAARIVMASDRATNALQTFQERLKTRLAWGLQVDVQPPTIETKLAILRLKAERDNIEVPNDVLESIAEAFSNIRQLEGALNRVVAYANFNGMLPSREIADSLLGDLIGSSNAPITPREIMEATADKYSLSLSDLTGPYRTRAIVTGRHVTMYLMRQLTDLSFPEIGKHLGGRDHTTVMNGVKKIDALMKQRKQVYDAVTELIQELQSDQ